MARMFQSTVVRYAALGRYVCCAWFWGTQVELVCYFSRDLERSRLHVSKIYVPPAQSLYLGPTCAFYLAKHCNDREEEDCPQRIGG